MRPLTLLALLCVAQAALAQAPKPLHLEVNTPTQPAVRFDANGNAIPSTLAEPTPPPKLDAVDGHPLPYQSVTRDMPWWFGPEIPQGPGRAWPTSWPAYGSPWGPSYSGPGWGGGWGGWGGFGPYW